MDDAGSLVLRGLLDGETDFNQLHWRDFHPGVDIYELYPLSDDGCHAALLRYHPGARVPMHAHTGYEHILIVRGSQQDGLGHYAAGSLIVKRPGTTHEVWSDEGCIVLAIWQRPVQFLARASQHQD